MRKKERNPKKGIHIGLIPDGNRRYANENNISILEGHRLGAKRIEEFIEWCHEYPEISMISIYALSTENMNRSKIEVNALWRVYRDELKKLLDHPRIKSEKMNVRVLGERGVWRPDIKDIARELYNTTKTYSRMFLNIMLAYGSKLEINEAVRASIRNQFDKLDKALYVKEPLDLVIRTGNQHRLSNFMLYQASYAEIYFSKKMWPEFTRKDFDNVMKWYHEQQRKFGH